MALRSAGLWPRGILRHRAHGARLPSCVALHGFALRHHERLGSAAMTDEDGIARLMQHKAGCASRNSLGDAMPFVFYSCDCGRDERIREALRAALRPPTPNGDISAMAIFAW